jgi:hypothetical protein
MRNVKYCGVILLVWSIFEGISGMERDLVIDILNIPLLKIKTETETLGCEMKGI